MRGHGAALATIFLLLLIAGVASALPTDPKLGKISAQGPVGLSSSKANVALLQGTGIKPGDSVTGIITLTNKGHTASVRLVGEAFSMQQVILTDTASLNGLDAYVLPQSIQFNIDLAHGVDRQTYMDALDNTLRPYGITTQPNTTSTRPPAARSRADRSSCSSASGVCA